MTFNDEVFAKATKLAEPVLKDFAKSLASTIAAALPQRRRPAHLAPFRREAQQLQSRREAMAREHQETLRTLSETAWSDAAIARIPSLDLAHCAFEHSGALRQEFGTLECFEAYWKNCSSGKIQRIAHEERGTQ